MQFPIGFSTTTYNIIAQILENVIRATGGPRCSVAISSSTVLFVFIMSSGSGEGRRRGKRRKKGGRGGSDRLTSAGLAAQAQQDPETQVCNLGVPYKIHSFPFRYT